MRELFFDHETHLFGRGNLAPRVISSQWAFDNDEIELEHWRDTPRLCEPGFTKIGANTAYDASCEMATDHTTIWPWIEAYCNGEVRDVQLDAKLLDIAEGVIADDDSDEGSYSLETQASEIGIQLEKEDWRKRFPELEHVPVRFWPEGASSYAKWDPRSTRAVHRHNQARAEKWAKAGIVVHGQHSALAAAAAHALHLASCWGVCTDRARTERVIERVHAHVESLRGDLLNAGLIRKDGSYEEQAAYRKWFREQTKGLDKDQTKLAEIKFKMLGRGAPDGKRSDLAAGYRMVQVMTEQGRRRKIALAKTGQLELEARVKSGQDPVKVHEELITRVSRGRMLVSLDEDAAILSGDELLVKRSDYVSSDGVLTRALGMRNGYVVPLQTSFNPLKASFRTSSRKPSENSDLEGEQMQNFPRGTKGELGLRENFAPRADHLCFIGGDFALAELHCLSELCHKLFGYSRMGEMLNAHIDLHWHFAAVSRGMTIEQVQAIGAAERDRAKPANFGFPGGMGAEKFVLYSRKSYGVIFTVQEVKPLKARWLEAFPEVAQYLRWVGDQSPGGSRDGKLTIVHPITGAPRGGMRYTAAANNGFQHLCAYAAKVALVEVNRACFTPGSPLFGWRIWNFVHDEILLEGPRAGASAAAKELGRIMTSAFNRFVPTYPTHVDSFVTSIWSKSCKGVVCPTTGEILEWKPKAA